MNSADIRQRWLDFFHQGNSQKLVHEVVPSASLIADDPNLLLVNAGMVPFKPYFLGELPPPYARATSVQKCVRTLDIDEVGKTTRHASFFQMCGNFSFGDYFKEGAIALAWELLTKSVADGGYGFDEGRLWVTIYEDDNESADIWRRVAGVPSERIQKRGMADNYWSMGVPGPCGPCSEIYFDRGPAYGKEGGPIADEDRYLEIWNLVFMTYIRGEGPGKEGYPILGELPAKNIDTGMGLERTAALLQGVENIYEIDTTRHILNRASSITGIAYGQSEKNDVALRVIADHARTAAMLIGDGVTPGNEGRGYVLRRMMRRTIRNMRILGAHDPNMNELITASIEAMGPQYPELIADQERILKVSVAEEGAFLETLKSGTVHFDLALSRAKTNKSASISGDDAFKLHDTYGFPFDLTLEMASEHGMSIDGEGFRRLMKEQKERAKQDARSKKSGHTDLSLYRSVIDASGLTNFVGYRDLSVEATIASLIRNGTTVDEAIQGDEVEVILNRTPFYAEGGGQLSDSGIISTGDATIEIDDVQAPVPGLFVHRGRILEGSVRTQNQVHAAIDVERRRAISRAHTATHMVHKAFREVLGETATQAGSENAPGRFRFDFPQSGPVSPDALAEVEGRVNALLLEDLEVRAEEMSQAEARAIGAMALFGEKYGERVRVVSVGDWARELCGGTHVARSGQLGLVKFLSESSIGAGVRRVEALVGVDAYGYLVREHAIINSLTNILKGSRPEELPERINGMLSRMKEIEKELASIRIASLKEDLAPKVRQAEKINGISVFTHVCPEGFSGDDLRALALHLRDATQSVVIALTSVVDGKVVLVVVTDEKARSSGAKAGALVKIASAILGGGGGGKDDFAQGGGVDISGIPQSLTALSNSLRM
ncbi:MAG: alanine--tRNA ligase [Actinobacteria bacterium]|nr:alanine--tRNA ligase [Actinomycetota bacterium]